MIVDNLPEGSSWQDLKDFIRTNGNEVKFTEIKDGKGVAGFETREQADKAMDTLNNAVMKNRDNKESNVTLTFVEPEVAEPASTETPVNAVEDERRSRSRGSPRYDE